MEVIGKIKKIESEKEVSNSFKKRDIIITTDEQYPQDISVQFVQDKCDLLNAFNVGDSVKIGINLRGREWTNQKGESIYFNTIQGWNINKLAESTVPSQEDDEMPIF
jgi:translation initiation factor IF-3